MRRRAAAAALRTAHGHMGLVATPLGRRVAPGRIVAPRRPPRIVAAVAVQIVGTVVAAAIQAGTTAPAAAVEAVAVVAAAAVAAAPLPPLRLHLGDVVDIIIGQRGME